MPFSRPDPPPDTVPGQALRDAVARGVIDEAQHAAVLALAGMAPPERTAEAPRGFNWVTVAYAAGAAAVVFAFGWFLVDRWTALGPAGVLAVALLYAAIFGVTAVQLRRHGFRIASGVATVLAVEMTPLATWALMRLAGLWPADVRPASCDLFSPLFLACNGKWMVIELASIGAALAALRWVKFAELAAPIAVALFLLTFHLTEALLGGLRFTGLGRGWSIVACASVMLTIAYAVDRRQREGGEDYAWWLYAAGLLAAFVGMFELWERGHGWRHALLPVGLVALAVSLYLRRRAFLAFGAATLAWYLGFLAFDVFRNTLAFPLLLATFGIGVIIGTVVLQRSYPRLATRLDERLGTAAGARRRPAAAYALFLAPLVFAIALMPTALASDRVREAELRALEAKWLREETARRQLAVDSARRAEAGGGATGESKASAPTPP